MKAKRTNEEWTVKKTWWKCRFLVAVANAVPSLGWVAAAWIYSAVTTGPTFGKVNTLNRNQEYNFCTEILFCAQVEEIQGVRIISGWAVTWCSAGISVPASPASERNRSEGPENWTSNTAQGRKTIIEKVILEKVLIKKLLLRRRKVLIDSLREKGKGKTGLSCSSLTCTCWFIYVTPNKVHVYKTLYSEITNISSIQILWIVPST